MSVGALIEECAKGSRLAQKKLFDTYSRFLIAFCMRYLNDLPAAEDAMITGFNKFFLNIKKLSFQNEAMLMSYLKKMMIHECLMNLRRQKMVFSDVKNIQEDISIHTNEIIEALTQKEIFNLILLLPTGYRTVFNLYVIEGYNHKEIAIMLNISEGTSKSQLSKARSVLQKMILDNEKI